MSTESPSKTGLYHRKSSGDYVVLWQGREIAVYASIDEFIDVHLQGLAALEESQNDLLDGLYKQP
ncbi:MAG: hypothetical protein ACI8Z1_002672 [Candidatus Azotimanducaceae bacterium]|jgi:hypothetical protein